MPTHHESKSPSAQHKIDAPGRGQQKMTTAGAPPGTPAPQLQHLPSRSMSRDLLTLQRSIGNRAVTHLLGKRTGTGTRAAVATGLEVKELVAPVGSREQEAQPSTHTGAIDGTIQRKIEQTFAQTQQPATKTNLSTFVKNIVLPELKIALDAVKEPHLAKYSATLDEYGKSYKQRVKNAEDYNYPKNWKLAAQALDTLIEFVNVIDMERSRPGQKIYDMDGGHEWKPIPGPMSKPGVPDQWGYAPDEVLDPDEYISFYHATTAKEKIENNAIVVMEGSKEFGQGFYTTSTDTDAPAKKIGQEWFTTKQDNPHWAIIRFSIPKKYADFLQSPIPAHNEFLNHIFTHATGYPNGGASPNAVDLQLINAINQEGRVLIFPDNKSTKVKVNSMGDQSWDDYTRDKLGGGGYELVIGPQQPEYMGNWRQYAFTGQRAIWLVNTARRFIAYENKKK